MYFSVPDELHYRPIGEHFVFLSLRTDRYSLLKGGAADRFRRFCGGTASECDIEWLLTQQLLVASDKAHQSEFKPIPEARSSLVDDPLPTVGLHRVAAAIQAQRKARRDLSRVSLGEILADLRNQEPVGMVQDLEACRLLVSAFQRARRYTPAIDQCLVRGVAIRRMLLRRKLEARLVLGITMPFSAHCWVQVGETVLTDPLDLVLSFEPLLSV